MRQLLETKGLTKCYGQQKALDNVSATIQKGDIYGLIGPNGAGKSTFLKTISGLIQPTAGDFTFYGRDGEAKNALMSRIGVLIEAPGIYPNLTAKDHLLIKGRLMGLNDKTFADELLDLVGLSYVGKKKVKNFSLGMKQRLGIALALVGNPDLVILDEPINGLDPQGIVEIRNTIEQLNRQHNITFIISSHLLEELSKLATRYGIINHGVLVEELTQEELYERGRDRLDIVCDDTEKATTVLEALGITDYTVVDPHRIQVFEQLNTSGKLSLELAKAGIDVTSLVTHEGSLEDYYMQLTGGHHA